MQEKAGNRDSSGNGNDVLDCVAVADEVHTRSSSMMWGFPPTCNQQASSFFSSYAEVWEPGSL